MHIITITMLKSLLDNKFNEEYTIDKYINRNGLKIVSYKNKNNSIRLTITAPFIKDFEKTEPFILVEDLVNNFSFINEDNTLIKINKDDLLGFSCVV